MLPVFLLHLLLWYFTAGSCSHFLIFVTAKIKLANVNLLMDSIDQPKKRFLLEVGKVDE